MGSALLSSNALLLTAKEKHLGGVASGPGPPAEAELIDGCRSGVVSAFERLYEAHGARMKSLAFSLTRNTADAEDAVQEAFLKIYRGMARFEGRSALSTWIYRIVVNACLDLKRRRKPGREEALGAQGEAFDDLAPVPPVDHPLRLTIQESLDRLDPRGRTVFLLFEVEGFKHREIAELLEIPEGTSKSLLFDAKRALQRLIFEKPGAGGARAT